MSEDHEFSILIQLEQQFKKILEDSFVYEETLDSKYIMIHEMEAELKKLSNELDKIDNNPHKGDS